jgi:hypothetical protein
MHSPESFVVGVGRGTGSLFKHFASGVISSTAAIVESASKGVAKGATILSGDADFAKQRDEKRRQQASGGLMAGMRAGGESVVSGFASGVTGLVTKPFEEGRKTGVTGFAKGLGLGAIGVIVKPVMGMTDGMAAVAHGISNQISEVPTIPQIRPPRALHRSLVDLEDLILVPLDILEAKAQSHAMKLAQKEQKMDRFVGAVKLTDVPIPSGISQQLPNTSQHSTDGGGNGGKKSPQPTGSLAYLTERYVVIAQYNAQYDVVHVELKLQYGDISHCVIQLDFLAVEFVVYKSSSGGGSGGNVLTNTRSPVAAMGCSTISINCSDEDACLALYSLLYRMSAHMGSPSNMVPPDVISVARSDPQDATNSCSIDIGIGSGSGGTASAVAGQNTLEGSFTAVDGYTFGSVNILKFASVACSESEVLQRCEDRLKSVVKTSTPGDVNFDPAAYQRELDQKVWRLVYEWQCIHTTIRASRCIAALVINRSEHHVQILRTEMMEGKNVRILGGTPEVGGYDGESRSILCGGGSAIIFAYGFTPNLIDPGHVKVRVFTSAFSGQISTRKAGTSCQAVGGYDVRYLEKSSTDWWAKYVILVS